MAEEIKRTAISISLFGESNVGKTCICGAFLGLEFLDEHLSTVGIEKMSSVIELESGENIKIKLWDTAGEERFRCISVNTLKSSQAAVVVFDLTNTESFERVTDWLKEIREFSSKFPVALFGNKSDLQENRKITQEQIDQLCQQEELIYYETSAKNNTGIKEGLTKIASIAFKAYEDEDIKKGEKLKADENKNNEKKKRSFC